MNVGTNRDKALRHALANAKTDGRPRYLHRYNGVYWLETAPPRPEPLSGSAASDYVVVFPVGTWENYDPTLGPPAWPS